MRKWTSRDRLESGRLPGPRCLTRFAVLSRGGYWSGSILSHRRLVTEAGPAAKARTLAIEYRLAPEQPFPAALDDALSAWRFLGKKGIAAGQMPMWNAHLAAGRQALANAGEFIRRQLFPRRDGGLCQLLQRRPARIFRLAS
jgi:hypothetical protein